MWIRIEGCDGGLGIGIILIGDCDWELGFRVGIGDRDLDWELGQVIEE